MTEIKYRRAVPPKVAETLPPHPIEFSARDPNYGRVCMRCGFSIPQGCRYVHAAWCEARAAHDQSQKEQR